MRARPRLEEARRQAEPQRGLSNPGLDEAAKQESTRMKPEELGSEGRPKCVRERRS